MADTKRLRILKAVSAHLADEVSVANGYDHDLGGSVWRGRTTFSDRDTLPRVTIIEALNPDREMVPAGTNSTTQKDGWVLLLLGHAQDDRDNPTDPAHALMGDVKKALGKIATRTSGATYMLGDLIAGIDIEPGTVRPPDELSALAYFYLRVRLTVVERLFDPYAT